MRERLENNGSRLSGHERYATAESVHDAPDVSFDPPTVTTTQEHAHRPNLHSVRALRRSHVAVAIDDLAFHHEVLDFLHRHPRIHLAATATTAAGASDLAARGDLDVLVCCPGLARQLSGAAVARRLNGEAPRLVVVAEEMTVPILREAIDVAAEAVLEWPEERAELADVVTATAVARFEPPRPRGRVVAVYGARGGAGTTFVAAHLAAVSSDLGLDTVLVDVDPVHAELCVALGYASETGARTIADLVAVADELSPEHVEDALLRHERGFGVLLSGPLEADTGVSHALYAGATALLATSHEVVVAHVSRAGGDAAHSMLRMADDVVIVATPDLFSLYGARAVIATLGAADARERCHVVLNRRTTGEVTAADFHRVLGIEAAAHIRFDARVPRAQDRGELLRPRRGKAVRDVRSLALSLLPAEPGKTRRGRSAR